MKILNFFFKPLFWLIFCFFALVVCGLFYLDQLKQVNPLTVTGVTSLSQREGQVSLAVQGTSLKQSSPAYLSLDATNRRAVVGNIPAAGHTADIEIAQNRAYVVNHSGGVTVFDLSVPTMPEMIGTLPAEGRGWRSDHSDDFLYLSSVTGGSVIQSTSRKGGQHRILESAVSSIHLGQHIFFANGKKGLSIYEYVRGDSGRGSSRPLSRLALPGYTRHLTFQNGYLIAASMSGGLHLVDISDTAEPRLLQTVTDQKKYGNVWSVGDVVYASKQDFQIDLFRLTQGRLTLVGALPLVGRVHDSLLDGDRLYLAESSFGISLLDVSDPEHPHRIGMVGTAGEAAGLALYGDYLYVASSSQGVQIVDTKLISSLNVLASINTPSKAMDLVLDGRWLYVADGMGGLQVVDRNDPAHFELVANLPTPSETSTLVKYRDMLFIVVRRHGLIGVDVSDPLQPKQISQLRLDVGLSDLAVRGSLLFVSTFDGQLLKIDLSAPLDLRVVDAVSLPGKPRRIALAGDDVIVMTEQSGLLVVRFSQDLPGKIIGHLIRPWPMSDFTKALGVAVRGEYAYLLQGEEGLQVVDISQPEKPREVGFLPLPDWGLSIGLTETFVVVSTRWSGYFFIDISQPEHPALVANLYLPRVGNRFKIEEDRLYTTGQATGVNVVPLPIKNNGVSRDPKVTFMFNKPTFPGWYNLSVSGGQDFVTAPSALRID